MLARLHELEHGIVDVHDVFFDGLAGEKDRLGCGDG
jgi:hypothetical protein